MYDGTSRGVARLGAEPVVSPDQAAVGAIATRAETEKGDGTTEIVLSDVQNDTPGKRPLCRTVRHPMTTRIELHA